MKDKSPLPGMSIRSYHIRYRSIIVHPAATLPSSRPNLDPDAPEEAEGEEGEEMEATTQDDEAMMAMMGMSGFGTTKVCISVVSIYVRLSYSKRCTGQTSRRKPGGCRQREKDKNVETVHEQVCTI